jgi:hypothetical protein
MSKYQGGLQTIHKVIIITGIVLVVIVGGAILFYNLSGEVIFKGSIEGKEVIYTEKKVAPINRVHNTMIVQDQMKTYKMYDYDETSIDWKNENKPNFEQDKLDKVIITENGEEKTYNASEKNPDFIDGQHVIKVFEQADELYNGLRNSIRTELREQYKREHQME